MKDFLEVLQEGEQLETNLRSRAAGIVRFEEKFASFLELITNKKGYSQNKRVYLMREAESTSDFPALFGTVIERTLKGLYRIQTPEYRSYIKTGTQNDFRPSNLIATYGLQAPLDQISELGEYKAAQLADGKVTCTLAKYGRQFPLSWEALVNDDLGAFNDLAQMLTNAAIRTEILNATKLIAQASGPNTSLFGTSLTHPIDGATVANKGTTPLDAGALFDTITLMQNQVDVDGYPIVADGFVLVVPPGKRKAGLEALSPAALIATGVGASAARQTSANVTSSLDIELVVNSFLPLVDTTHGATTWYVFAKLSNGAAAQLNFLRGHENPEIVQQASDKVSLGGGSLSPLEGNFSNDSMRWRVRHIMGGATVDPRMAYAQAATT